MDTRFVEQQAKEFHITCASCAATSYIATEGHFDVLYHSSQENVTVQNAAITNTDFACKLCPSGANCPGNDFNVKPNFWGYRADDEIVVRQCPADYCCTGENCIGFDSCSSHRTGVLCGRCEDDYSLSMLSSECIKADNCNSHWLWPLVFLALIVYVMWYTFKNNVFAIPASLVQQFCKNRRRSTENIGVDYIDKGYFGILTYFVQIKAVMGLSISLDHTRGIDKIFNSIESYIRLALNFEISNISNDTCVLDSLTTTDKMMLKLIFLFGVYFCWSSLFLFTYIIEYLTKQYIMTNADKLATLRIKLIDGLVEIMKYTYLGFTSVVFYSLTCSFVADKYVWFNDGSVQCYSKWQVVMIIFCLSYILPFPFLIYIGMKLLNNRKISQHSFFIASWFPLPVVLYWLFLSHEQKYIEKLPDTPDNEEVRQGEQAIYKGFVGGFRESEEGTQYWECVLMVRRLFISATILIPNPLIQLSICLAMCIAFLLHHTYVKPFRYSFSNKVEAVSLALLCGVAAINMLKASFIHAEVSLQGPQAEILRNLELVEILFVIGLIGVVVCFEAAIKIVMRAKSMTKATSAQNVKKLAQCLRARTQARRIHPYSDAGSSNPDHEDGVSTPPGLPSPFSPDSGQHTQLKTVCHGYQVQTISPGHQIIEFQPGKRLVVQVLPSSE